MSHETIGAPLTRRRCLAFLSALVAAPASRWAGAHDVPAAPVPGFELPIPRDLKPFALRDHRGGAFDNASLNGRWTFLFFGYTHCTDICPTTLLQLRQVRRTLTDRHHVDTVPVFVTIDPARDTRERLAAYATRFGDGLVAVGGTTEAIRAFSAQFHVRYTKRSGAADARHYDIDHTSTVTLLGPDGKLYAVFMLPLRADGVADSVARIAARQSAAQCGREQHCSEPGA